MYDFTPRKIDDIVFGDSSTAMLVKEIVSGRRPFPSNGKNTLMAHGVFGTGKTTFAKIFFEEYERAFGGEIAHIDTFTADNSMKITSLIDRLESQTQLVAFNHSGKHYFIFDEVDNWKEEQQQRLKAWMNTTHAVCVMTTNYLYKIDDGLLSRCHYVDMNATQNTNEYVQRMKQLIQQHGMVALADKYLLRIADTAEGDWRTMCDLLIEHCGTPVMPTTQTPKRSARTLTLVK